MLTLVTSEKSFGNRWVGHRRWNERRDLHPRRMALAERMAALRRTYSSAARQIVGVPHAAAKTQLYLTVNRDDQANYDIQRDLYRDTVFSAMKLWLFLRPVAAADGPFTFVLGSHWLTPERLAWEQAEAVSFWGAGTMTGGGVNQIFTGRRYDTIGSGL